MEDLVVDMVVLYTVLFGAMVYRTGDVFMSFLVVTGVLLTLFPLTILAHRRVFQRWLPVTSSTRIVSSHWHSSLCLVVF